MTKLLDRSAAAARIGVCAQTLVKLVAAQQGPAVTRVGKRDFFTENALETWIAAQTVQPATVA